MALIKCPECGKECELGLKNCPQCGCPLKKQGIPRWVNIVLGGMILALLIMLIYPVLSPQDRMYMKYQKKAQAFIKELPTEGFEMETIIDTVVRAVFYGKQTQNGVEFHCYDLSNEKDETISVENDIREVTDYRYSFENRCIFILAETNSSRPSDMSCALCITVNNRKVQRIANGLSALFNDDYIRLEKVFGMPTSIWMEDDLNEIINSSSHNLNDVNDWGL